MSNTPGSPIQGYLNAIFHGGEEDTEDPSISMDNTTHANGSIPGTPAPVPDPTLPETDPEPSTSPELQHLTTTRVDNGEPGRLSGQEAETN